MIKVLFPNYGPGTDDFQIPLHTNQGLNSQSLLCHRAPNLKENVFVTFFRFQKSSLTPLTRSPL